MFQMIYLYDEGQVVEYIRVFIEDNEDAELLTLVCEDEGYAVKIEDDQDVCWCPTYNSLNEFGHWWYQEY